MDGTETLKKLCNPFMKYKGYPVFDVHFNGIPIKMMCLEDVKHLTTTASPEINDDPKKVCSNCIYAGKEDCPDDLYMENQKVCDIFKSRPDP